MAALALRPNTFVTSAELADLLWDEPPKHYRSNIRTYVSRLRRHLDRIDGAEARIASSRGGPRQHGGAAYALRLRELELDADIFVRFVTRARAEARRSDVAAEEHYLREALGLWRGVAGGPDVSGSRRLLSQLDAFNTLRISAQEDLLTARLRQGEHGLLVPELRALLTEYPYRETLWIQLIYAHHRSRDVETALSVYRELQGLLDTELGVEPGEQVRRMHHAVLARDDNAATRTLLTR
ncbi:AfsR/SARP family transcriptional regulator [Actinocorallia aurea]